MASQAQIDANRANAQKSTGPKTPEGKARSSKNHLSHGFTSQDVVMADENREAFESLLDALIEQFQPANITEQILVEKMAQNQWLTLRALRCQAKYSYHTDLFNNGLNPKKALSVFIRYHGAADRAFHKAHAELVKAQKQRQTAQIGFESQKPAAAAPNPPQPPQKPAPQPPAVPDFATPEVKIIEIPLAPLENLVRAA